MKRWREEQRVRARLGAALPAVGETLAADVARYLTQVQTMTTLRHRRDDLARWIVVFGADRARASITPGEIRAQLERWRAAGYAANTCNHRRTALMHLWTVLDGKSKPNPARDVPRYPDSSREAPPRALSREAIAAIFDAMPESQTKARLAVIAWTGWPPAQLARLMPSDIVWHDVVRVSPRRKGKGTAGAWLPLLPQAWAALEAFKRYGCWGAFSTASARTSFRLAAAKVAADPAQPDAIRRGLENVTPYVLRHSFLSMVAALTQDDRAVMVLAQHSDIRTTHRYTESTADPRVRAAIQRVTAALNTL